MIEYHRLKSIEELNYWWSDIMSAFDVMVKKNSSLTTTEHIMRMVVQNVGKDTCFLLVVTDGGTFIGCIFALSVGAFNSWVEVIGLYCKPGYFKKCREETFETLKKWAFERKATYILTCVTRQVRTFHKFFYEPLGFKQIGLILEARL